MKTRHVLAILLHASGNSISSKTKIQKEMYFLSKLLDEDFAFRAHYYGPYSPVVEQALDELIGAGFLGVKREVYGLDYQRGFEMKRFDYHLTPSGEKLAEELEEQYSSEVSTISEFVEKMEAVGNPDYLDLSVAAKVYFILDKQGGKMAIDEIKKEAREFDWQINEDDVSKAVDILKQLEFAS
jgi:hypothetical protein